ncbi:MAG: response regulator [Nitrospirae bacterium]|nr:response regulator [Nitrospirota bacterium]
MPLPESSHPTSILLIEPNRGLALKLEDMLIGHFQAVLDQGTAGSLRESMTYLCAHQVSLVVMDLTLPDYKGLDAVRALRMTTKASALIAFSTVANETLLLEAIRAGAHEALCIATPSAQEFSLVIERAMVRTGQPAFNARATPLIRQAALSPALLRLAHDLNNAITSINGFADLLLTQLPVDEPARTCAEQIRKAGARATMLVKAWRLHPSHRLPFQRLIPSSRLKPRKVVCFAIRIDSSEVTD